jgi:putative ABC transport system permease protein
MAETIRRKIHEFEPRRSVYDLTPLADHISDGYAENRLRTILLAFFAITAVSLACVGIYGTLSYLVNAQRREVALRLALGALRTQVVRQFLGLGVRVALLGCMAGLLLAAGFQQFLSGMLYGVSATDAATVGGVVAIVLAVSLILRHTRIRASRVEPTQALRERSRGQRSGHTRAEAPATQPTSRKRY